ncbi:hypothetical protein RI049_14520 [Cedecea neteri]|uniref:hypothetical protein n=1 Tax=Cedecea neteri TaxID=158822 RepID=UPI002AA63051|nr:hypothetical protein [Cedecea neteri]WPU21301.1 hypothetical protein RI049_14520 [Cedecea neteri]
MNKMLIICAVLLTAHAYAANKPASELVWGESENKPGRYANICLGVGGEENEELNIYDKLDKSDPKRLNDPYSKSAREKNKIMRCSGIIFKFD